MRKRELIGFNFAALATLVIFSLVFSWTPVLAQEAYPDRPITMIVGYGAGGGTDLITRTLSDLAKKMLGQPIVVINKPGGTSSVALSALKAEKPDGYTLGVMPSGGVFTALINKVPYDPAKDFTPIIQYSAYQDGLAVLTEAPWKTFRDFIEYAKNNPGRIRYASSGVGTPEVLNLESLAREMGIKWMHLPYDNSAHTGPALLGGHVDAIADSSFAWKPFVDSGKFRLLATFHEERLKTYPNVPTLLELGYNKKAASFIGIVGPKGMAEPIVKKLHDAFKKAMEDPHFINTIDKIGYLMVYRNSEDLNQYIQQIVSEEGATIKKLGLRK